MAVGIYLHIPFCRQKCPYCDFYSVPYTPDLGVRYTQAMTAAIQSCPYPLQGAGTVYFGGGTPSLLGPRHLGHILRAMQEQGLSPHAEITLEANPACVTAQELVSLRQAGFNRISFGVQSASDQTLQLLGRLHTTQQAAQSVREAQEAGFENCSVDLMAGLPGQSYADLQEFVDLFTQLGVPHLSVYMLKIEPGTPFAALGVAERCPTDDQVAWQMLQMGEYLAQTGLRQYEISNFARPGYESRHNLTYWNCDEYVGIGPAAHSFVSGRRLAFPNDLSAFLASSNPWSLLSDHGPGGDFAEYAMLRLRLADGLSSKECARRYPERGAEHFAAVHARARLVPPHLLRVTPGHLAFTPQGFLVSNRLTATLLSPFL